MFLTMVSTVQPTWDIVFFLHDRVNISIRWKHEKMKKKKELYVLHMRAELCVDIGDIDIINDAGIIFILFSFSFFFENIFPFYVIVKKKDC